MRLAGRAGHPDARPGDALGPHPLRDERQTLDAEPAEPALDRRRLGAGVQQRAEQHVARDARHAVHVQRPGHVSLPAERAIRAAIVPAPKPSSMPTTASPAAHEDSMESRAVTPPNAVP